MRPEIIAALLKDLGVLKWQAEQIEEFLGQGRPMLASRHGGDLLLWANCINRALKGEGLPYHYSSKEGS